MGWGSAEPCGELKTQVVVVDYGNGTCRAQYKSQNYTCTTQLFRRECKSLADTLVILIQNAANLPADSFSVNIGKFMFQLGLSGLIVIGGGLGILVDSGPPRIPTPINLDILSSLKQVGNVDIKEVFNSTYPPPNSRLKSVTLRNLQFIVYKNGEVTLPSTLSLTYTDFADMTSFRDLTCPPPVISLIGNQRLTSLEGLNRLATPTTSAVNLTIRCQPCSSFWQASTVGWYLNTFFVGSESAACVRFAGTNVFLFMDMARERIPLHDCWRP